MSENPFRKLEEIKARLPVADSERLPDKPAGSSRSRVGRTASGDRAPLKPQPAPGLPDGPPPVPKGPTDEELFLKVMVDEGVTPLPGDGNFRTPVPPSPDSFPLPKLQDEDAWTLERLTELVNGEGDFDLASTDEYVEGHVKGLNPLMLRQLKEGRYHQDTHLDLHGYTLAEAQTELNSSIPRYVSMGFRMVLIIHGRGLRSPDGIPVLKLNLGNLLLRTSSIRKHILAFVTAQPFDGGTGACYVLLRRKKAVGKRLDP
ncbi:MAG: Smr/MutS family protein [Deltaproteobacteria bacterium]|jgi:DNA-nicking Smr family endonuclease|nr:Smr/MutS family protein [Deltaproteobacteria bacterium]